MSKGMLGPAGILGCVLLTAASPALAGNPPAAAPAKADPGFGWSIQEGTQFNFGKLHIGAGYMGGGVYFDEKDVRRNGLHASLQIAVDEAPSLFQQPDVHEGQILEVGGYKILIEKIIPGERGTIVFRVWSPPKVSSTPKGSTPTLFFACFISLGVLVLAWLGLVASLFSRLKRDHHDTYVQLGEPTLFWNNSIKNGIAFLGFLLRGKYKQLNDSKLTRHCQIMVLFFLLYLVVFITTGVAMFMAQLN